MFFNKASTPPLWSIFAIQLVSVAGDQLGQRASRHDYKSSSRRMLIALTAVSCIQVFLFLGALQLLLSSRITGAIYEDSKIIPCYEEVDIDGHLPEYCERVFANCTKIPCPSQGPFSVFRSLSLHPLLLLNGCMNIAYYVGEVLLYQHPLGLIFIVFAALSATFVIQPFEQVIGLESGSSIPAIVILFGIIGSFFCVIEQKVRAGVSLRAIYEKYLSCCVASSSDDEDEDLLDHSVTPGRESPDDYRLQPQSDETVEIRTPPPPTALLVEPPSLCRKFANSMKVLVPFVCLSATYGCWFVTQKYFNNEYHTNVYGYTSIDQCLTPFYMLTFLFFVDKSTSLRGACVPQNETSTTFCDSAKDAYSTLFSNKCQPLLTIFMYRLLINARAMAYFYMSVSYNLAEVYLELTLVRIVLSWLAAVVVCLVAPQFIALEESERNTVFHPINLLFKTIGTGFIIAALILMN